MTEIGIYNFKTTFVETHIGILIVHVELFRVRVAHELRGDRGLESEEIYFGL